MSESVMESPSLLIELSCLKELTWPMCAASFPMLRHLRLGGSFAGKVRIEATIRWRETVLATLSASATTPSPMGTPLDLDGLFSWHLDECSRFIDRVAEANLEVTLKLEADGKSALHALPPASLAVHSPKHWDCGLVRAGGTFSFVRELPALRLAAQVSLSGVSQTNGWEATKSSIDTAAAYRMVSSVVALCLPKMPAIAALRAATEQWFTRGGSAGPYNINDKQVEFLLGGLHTELMKRFSYNAEPLVFSEGEVFVQAIRTPDEIGEVDAIRLNCIDASLVMAAVVEEWKLRPVIVLAPSSGNVHAMLAVVLPSTRTVPWERSAASTLSAAFELDVDALACLFIVDFTEKDFRIAVGRAPQELKRAGRLIGIDIQLARDLGCHPLPLHLKQAGSYWKQAKEAASDYALGLNPESDPGQADRIAQVGPDEIFVPILCRRTDKPGQHPSDAVCELARADGKVRKVIVRANSGAGKSYLLAKQFLDELRAYRDKGGARVPVYLPLSRYSLRLPFVRQLGEWLRSNDFPATTEAELRQSVMRGDFTFFLDGLDEMGLRGGQLEEHLKPLESVLHHPNTEVILSGRTGLFGINVSNLLPEFQVIDLEPWGIESWYTLLDRYVETGHLDASEAMQLRLKVSPKRREDPVLSGAGWTKNSEPNATYRRAYPRLLTSVAELITKPLYCKMIVVEREHVLNDAVQNVGDLFRKYVKRFWERRYDGSDLSSEEKTLCMMDIAYRMELDQCADVTADWILDYVNKHRPDPGKAEWARFLAAVRVYSFLDTTTSENQERLAFSHKSFREFFLAEHLVRALSASPPALREFDALAISQEVVDFAIGLLELEGISVPAVRSASKNIARNLALLHIGSTGRCPSACSLQSAKFSGLSLRNVDFSECRLREAEFINCDLSHAVFRNADLTGAKLRNSNIFGTDFTGATYRKEQLAECREIQ